MSADRFLMTHGSATPEKAQAAATRVEAVFGRSLRGEPRALNHLAVEDVALLVQFARDGGPLPAAARDVLAERQRQISGEGWTPEHDDEHDICELGRAAACYAVGSEVVGLWPTGWEFKDGGRRRNLVKAGALILAEIARLDRAALVLDPATKGGAV